MELTNREKVVILAMRENEMAERAIYEYARRFSPLKKEERPPKAY